MSTDCSCLATGLSSLLGGKTLNTNRGSEARASPQEPERKHLIIHLCAHMRSVLRDKGLQSPEDAAADLSLFGNQETHQTPRKGRYSSAEERTTCPASPRGPSRNRAHHRRKTPTDVPEVVPCRTTQRNVRNRRTTQEATRIVAPHITKQPDAATTNPPDRSRHSRAKAGERPAHTRRTCTVCTTRQRGTSRQNGTPARTAHVYVRSVAGAHVLLARAVLWCAALRYARRCRTASIHPSIHSFVCSFKHSLFLSFFLSFTPWVVSQGGQTCGGAVRA